MTLDFNESLLLLLALAFGTVVALRVIDGWFDDRADARKLELVRLKARQGDH